MATSDELRAKLTKALDPVTHDFHGFHFTERVTRGRPSDILDALLPVVVEALAEAWDDGRTSNERGFAADPLDNPWRRP